MNFKTSLGGKDIINIVCDTTFIPDEGSIREIPIHTGDDRFESNVTLRIRIFNENGDYRTFNTTFQNVTTPKQYFPLGEDDEKKLENLLRDFNKTVSYIRAGGDTMRTFRYVGSVASMFARHKRNVTVTTEEDILRGETDVKFYEDSPIEKKYKEENKLIEILENVTKCFTIRMGKTMEPLPNDNIEPIEEIMKRPLRRSDYCYRSPSFVVRHASIIHCLIKCCARLNGRNICVFGKNPLIYGNNASSLTSDVFVSDFGNETIVDVTLKNKGTRIPYKFSPLYSQYVDEKITHFYFDVTNDDDAILIYLKPEGFDVNSIENRTMYWVYVSPKPFPTTSTSENRVYKKLETAIRNWDSELGYKMFAPANVCPKGICYLGIKPIEYLTDSTAGSPRMKRDVASIGQLNGRNSSYFNPAEANFTLQIVTTACRTWKRESKTWESDNCQVLPDTTVDETVCRCIGHIFSTTFHIPPNLIDLYNVWGKFDVNNASVYGTIIALFVIYIVLAVILRREDRKDIDRSQRETELDRVHKKRREHLQEICRYKKMTFLGFSPENAILAGKSKSKSPFDIDPGDALGGNVKTFSDLPFYMITAIVSSYKKFIIVRNPFERLFSGYIDKIFSLTFSHIGKHIVLTQRPNATHHSKQCGHDVTFAEFVKYFIQGERTKKHRDGHFIPMYDHCKPCQIGYDYIAKLETLEKDTIYILKQLNFSSMASSLEKGFKEKTKNDSAEDQTDLLFRYMKVLEKCISRHEIQKIFWRKEQIRGLIDPDIRFPFSEKESSSLTQEQYLGALHRSVGRTRSKEMAKKFRRDALLKAYSTIPKSDLEALKEILKPDCEIFDYDCNSV
uniref:Carbohydrate sulfotransferase n=1 Tax=Magallana gigas TaxID=29159 RepID=K1RBF9_MAGGI